MLVSYVAFLILGQKATSLRDLAYARGSFESRVTYGHGHLYVMAMNSNGYNEAYDPIGVASRRYLIDYGSGEDLVFQKMLNGMPRTIWRLELGELTPSKPRRQVVLDGTLHRLLTDSGLEIEARRLTATQRAAVGAKVEFVGYWVAAESHFLRVSFVEKDGTEKVTEYAANRIGPNDDNPIDLKPPFCPIPAQESQLLGFGPTEWHGTGNFEVHDFPYRG